MPQSINKTILAAKFGWTLRFFVHKLNTSPELLSELKDSAKYNLYQRIYTPKQIEIIYKHFGNPEK